MRVVLEQAYVLLKKPTTIAIFDAKTGRINLTNSLRTMSEMSGINAKIMHEQNESRMRGASLCYNYNRHVSDMHLQSVDIAANSVE